MTVAEALDDEENPMGELSSVLEVRAEDDVDEVSSNGGSVLVEEGTDDDDDPEVESWPELETDTEEEVGNGP